METKLSYGRTGWCGQFTIRDARKPAVVCGWVSRMRNLGGLIFIDLRDRTGILQCTFDSAVNQELFDLAFTVRSEFCLKISGVIRLRKEDAINHNLPTGQIELAASELKILSRSETPPFEIVEDSDVNDALRLKHRYLDLRRPDMQRGIALRSRLYKVTRDFFSAHGFMEIETPMLTKSTPEGARDYLVPSRTHPGKFYALPQSPQQYKQLLMLAGFDRYMQITRCFRDEDLRADRQPEFTQIDLEMSFVDADDVMELNEQFLHAVFLELAGVEIPPIPRLSYKEAMERFGSDKPDLRFGCELTDISDIVKDCGFKVFSEPAAAGGSVRLINVKGGAGAFPRKQVDALVEFVKAYRAKGLAWTRLTADGTTSSFGKFLTEDENAAVLRAADAQTGDLILIVADADNEVVFAALGALRAECARRMEVIEPGYRFVWVTDFPLFEYDAEEKRYVAKHHPFTMPRDEDIPLLDTDPGSCRAKAYDIVVNGFELGGGSIRISDIALQEKMFACLGFTREQAYEQFGHLMEAFKYGPPPHGGLAYGLDRMAMILTGQNSIRDVIAFPKVQNASEPMTSCPAGVDERQLDELGIKLKV